MGRGSLSGIYSQTVVSLEDSELYCPKSSIELSDGDLYMQEKSIYSKTIRLPNDLLSCRDVQTIISARLQVVAGPDPVQRRCSLGLNEVDIDL